jgi:hypothetical protein
MTARAQHKSREGSAFSLRPAVARAQHDLPARGSAPVNGVEPASARAPMATGPEGVKTAPHHRGAS